MENFLKGRIILKNGLILILLVLITAILYYPTFHSVPLWDDWNFIFKSWTLTKYASPWDFWLWGEYRRSWPMFYSTMSIMYKLWKGNALNYHLAAALFHALNSFLIYRVLRRLNGSYPLLISILYLVHPLQFFNVIWIIQIKTLMCIFFFLISLLFFLKYEKNLSKSYYILSVIFFGLSLFSKASLAPIVLLLIFYKHKKRMIPFIVLCIYSAVLTIWSTHIKPNSEKISNFSNVFISQVMAQSGPPAYFAKQGRPQAIVSPKFKDPLKNIQLTLNNLKRYTVFLIYPGKTLLVQRPTEISRNLNEIVGAALITTAIFSLLLYYWTSKNSLSFWGLNFFLVTLIPLGGIFFIPIFHFSNFVDYWLAVPVLGLLICLNLTEFRFKPYIITSFIIFFSAKTFIQVRKTPEPISIINASIEQLPKKPTVKLILAKHYFNIGEYAKSNKVIENVKNTSIMDRTFLQKQIDENVKGMLGQEVDDGAL